MTALEYDLHGVRLAVEAPDSPARRAIDARLAHCRASGTADADVHFEIRTDLALKRPPGVGRPVYPWDVGEVSYFDEVETLYITVGDHTVLVATPRDGRVRIATSEAMLAAPWLLARPLLTLPLVETLKWRGLYSLHAAGAAAGGRAVILPGASGSGKSTLALAMARHGLDFLSDDMLFLTRGEEGVRVHAFPEEIDVSVESASWFEELSGLGDVPLDGWPKHRVHVTGVFEIRLASVCAPGAIVFPAIAGVERSTLEPLSAAEALVELAPNVLLTDRAMAQRHLDILGELARTTPVHRLATGTDLEQAVQALQRLVAARPRRRAPPEGRAPSDRSGGPGLA